MGDDKSTEQAADGNLEGESEIHIKKSGPSGWDTPENIRLMIETIPPKVSEWIESARSSERAATEAAKVMHGRIVMLAGLVSVGVIAAAVIGLLSGKGGEGLAERLLVPLLTFIGGLGLGARFTK